MYLCITDNQVIHIARKLGELLVISLIMIVSHVTCVYIDSRFSNIWSHIILSYTFLIEQSTDINTSQALWYIAIILYGQN